MVNSKNKFIATIVFSIFIAGITFRLYNLNIENNYFFSANLPEPTEQDFVDMEADAMAWYQVPSSISYYDFWELLTFPLQIAVSNHKQVTLGYVPIKTMTPATV